MSWVFMVLYTNQTSFLQTTILEKNPWNTLGIFNQIKHVFLMWIKMFNIGYQKKAGT